MRSFTATTALLTLMLLSGCHSHYIQATITNASGAGVNVVQVDYPSASFGVQTLAPGQVFRYRFKLLGSGNVKIGFVDAHNAEHHIDGPWLDEGAQGTLDVTIPSQSTAKFSVSVHP